MACVGGWVSFGGNDVRERGVGNAWEEQEDADPECAIGVNYKRGDIVTDEGQRYECRQAHRSIAGWQPPNVLALWLPI